LVLSSVCFNTSLIEKLSFLDVHLLCFRMETGSRLQTIRIFGLSVRHNFRCCWSRFR
jgi:hypothetical protein